MTAGLRYQASQRYSAGLTRPALASPSWEFCECCQRETPHMDNCCVYDGMPNRKTCALFMQRFRAWRTSPNVEYRPYDDRYVRTA